MLGGKFGAKIADVWNHSTVGELWSVPRESIKELFGPEGDWVYEYLRGIDSSAVLARTENQSMKYVKWLTARPRTFLQGLEIRTQQSIGYPSWHLN